MNERFVSLIELLGLTPSEFSAQTGIGLSVISHIKNGRNKPGLDQLVKVLDTYRSVSAEWMLHGTGSWKKEDQLKTLKTDISFQLNIITHEMERLNSDILKIKERLNELSQKMH